MMNKGNTVLLLIVMTAAGIASGFFIGKSNNQSNQHQHGHTEASDSEESSIWTCSMHPQVQNPGPGKCPLCFMDLIPLIKDADDGDGSTVSLKMSKGGEALADIEVQPAVRKFVDMELSLVGKIAYNESRLSYITARMPGRIDRLFVNYTGIAVRKDDHMAEYYSPDLLVAQQELLYAAKKNRNDLKSVIKKLKLWGLTQNNIDQILDTGEISDHITLYPQNAGIVIEKPAVEGKYFKTGDRLFTVADLSKVWINLEAYENDLQWLRYGQQVTFTSVAYPGEKFRGRISFIEPMLDPKTRVVKVRVDADNTKGLLKPGMFVHASAHPKLSATGLAPDTELAGKWISPMHPEIIKDEPGNCDVCGMDLVKAETLGYVGRSDSITPPLVIPASAPLLTGKRAVVYIKDPKKEGRFEGRVVTLGQRVGDFYIVKNGIEDGELVVTKGNFKIDSALQIQAKPSMMSMQDEPKKEKKQFEVTEQFTTEFDQLLNLYFNMQSGLSGDSLENALSSGKELLMAFEDTAIDNLAKQGRLQWFRHVSTLTDELKQFTIADSIEKARTHFEPISKSIEELIKAFGHNSKLDIIKFHCPMAFNDKGASWLQNKEGVLNPYFGAMMLQCGMKTEDIHRVSNQKINETKEPQEKEDSDKPSMPSEFVNQLDMILTSYFAIQKGLSSDNHADAIKGSKELSSMFRHINSAMLVTDSKENWQTMSNELKLSSKKISKSKSIAIAREHFLNLSATVESMVRMFGTSGKVAVIKFYCSMAFDNKGAAWLQDHDELLNPYWGAMMLHCGEKIEEISK